MCKYWSVILLNVPQFEFVCCFLMIGLRLCVFDKNNTEIRLCPSQYIISQGSVCLQVQEAFLIFVMEASQSKKTTVRHKIGLRIGMNKANCLFSQVMATVALMVKIVFL